MRPAPLAIAIVIAATGCGTVISQTRLNPTPQDAHRNGADAVDVLGAGPPTRAHVDIALFVADRRLDTSEQAIAKLRERAGAMGCNAIVIDSARSPNAGVAPTNFTATCVVYR
jgi:hypothetical protein